MNSLPGSSPLAICTGRLNGQVARRIERLDHRERLAALENVHEAFTGPTEAGQCGLLVSQLFHCGKGRSGKEVMQADDDVHIRVGGQQ